MPWMSSNFIFRRLAPTATSQARPGIVSCIRHSPRSPTPIPQINNKLNIQCRPFASFLRRIFGSDKPKDETPPAPYYSPYQPKRQWPPDISKLSHKHQFRLERRYRRRAAMKWERPRWNKWTKIVQYGLYAFILIYALFGLDWEKDHPVAKFRDYLISSFKSVFTPLPPPESMRKTEDKAKKD